MKIVNYFTCIWHSELSHLIVRYVAFALIMLVTRHEIIDGECRSWKSVLCILKIRIASRVSSLPFSNPGDTFEIIHDARNNFASIDWHFREYQMNICSRFNSQQLFRAIIGFIDLFSTIIARWRGQSYFVEYRLLLRASAESGRLQINY